MMGRAQAKSELALHKADLKTKEVEKVDHPDHYGGADNPYEAIKIIEAHALGFHFGNTVKYLLRAGKKPGSDATEDVKKARWYLDRWLKTHNADGKE